MQSLPNIQHLIDENRTEKALECLNLYIEQNDKDDEGLFMRGRVYWRMQKYAAAVTDFEAAVAINPESGAQSALELARDVFNFYNPDLLNP